VSRLERHRLTLALFNLPPGDRGRGERGMAALPGRESEFMDSLDRARLRGRRPVQATARHGRGLACAAGSRGGEGDLHRQSLARGRSRRAAWHDRSDRTDQCARQPGYFLKTTGEALAILNEVGRDNVKLQPDLDHCFAYLLELLDRIGYDGWVGCEYRPAAAEAMALDMKAGVDPDQLHEAIVDSAGSSWMFQNRVPHILAGDYTPRSAVDIFVKDLGIVLETGAALCFPLPMAEAAYRRFTTSSANGFGRQDDVAVIKVYASEGDLELPPTSNSRSPGG
jgi:hypothetical protein